MTLMTIDENKLEREENDDQLLMRVCFSYSVMQFLLLLSGYYSIIYRAI